MTGHEDCRYWGLTDAQCFRHHLRLSRWCIDQSRRFVAESERHARAADRVMWWRAGLLIVALVVGAVLA